MGSPHPLASANNIPRRGRTIGGTRGCGWTPVNCAAPSGRNREPIVILDRPRVDVRNGIQVSAHHNLPAHPDVAHRCRRVHECHVRTRTDSPWEVRFLPRR